MNFVALVTTALAAGLAMWISTSVYNRKLADINRQLDATRQALNEQSLEVAQMRLMAKATTRASQSNVIMLEGKSASGALVISGDTLRACVFGLKPSGADQKYVLRLNTKEGIKEVGTIRTDADGNGAWIGSVSGDEPISVQVRLEPSGAVELSGTAQ